VNRTGGARGGASVSYATAKRHRLGGTDYTATHGSLSWGSRDAAPKSFVIPISNARLYRQQDLCVAIAGASWASLGTSTSAHRDDQRRRTAASPQASPPTVTLSASPTSVSRGSGST